MLYHVLHGLVHKNLLANKKLLWKTLCILCVDVDTHFRMQFKLVFMLFWSKLQSKNMKQQITSFQPVLNQVCSNHENQYAVNSDMRLYDIMNSKYCKPTHMTSTYANSYFILLHKWIIFKLS